ncbi:MAG: (p)ppGpp synthetase, RelA/SpoT family, partial [Actinomycetia bacterium]|nr:(p)ppGpp synthetase, RelA/SpoT family [Actinomycetes bacterium]
LHELRISGEVTGRPKHLWSIYEKMVVKGKEFGEIFDLVGIRVVVDRVEDCYAALGSIHATWKPVQGRIKDYIAMPKFNLYQSLHTTVVGPQGKPVEVQIRTREMHTRAELGVAAHYAYKDGDLSGADMAWLNRIVDWQSESDPNEFMETLRVDLEQDEVFVFTPKGKVITLPDGATPIDFAYAIHTGVGHACIGARVNGRLQPLDSKLQSGDTVEIFTSKVDHSPSRDWLNIAVTPRAINKIKQWFSRERREDALETGKDELTRALRREGLPVQKLLSGPNVAEVAKAMSYVDVDALYVAIGENHVSGQSVAQRIARDLRSGEGEEQLPITARAPRRRKPTSGVHVEGLDDVMVRLSRCCTPVPGDEIMGFVTRGRGVSVHRADCANATSLASQQNDRLIDVEWDQNQGNDTFVVSIEVRALDRSRLLRDVSASLADHHVNILACATQTGTDRISRMRFDFELADPSHLDSLLGVVRRIESVYDAYRLLPGQG